MWRILLATAGISTAAHAALFLVPAQRQVATGTSGEPAEFAVEPLESPVERATEEPSVARAVNPPADPATRHELRSTPARASTSPAPSVATAPPTDDAMPRFTMAIGGSPSAVGHVAAGASPLPDRNPAAGQPMAEALVDGKARLTRGASPAYPEDARARDIEGDVHLELVVDAGGSVESDRVIQGVDPSLDEAALVTARRFRFEPATKAGRPVAVRMRWAVQFRLR